MIGERPTTDWVYLITLHYGLDLSTSALLEYFRPLERYLDEAPLEQAPIVTTTTTTTAAMTTTTTTTTGAPQIEPKLAKEDQIQSDQPKVNATRSGVNTEANPTSNATTYAGVGLLVFVSCLLVVVYGYKHLRRRRRRTNNRRFAS